MDYKAEYERWLQLATDEEINDELKGMDDVAVEDAFYRNLAFGTGGLRCTIGTGTNRMNIYVVAKASQGLSDYLLKTVDGQPSVVVGYDSRIKIVRVSRICLDHAAVRDVERPRVAGRVRIRIGAVQRVVDSRALRSARNCHLRLGTGE